MSLVSTGHRYFLAVAEHRSIREAADRLRIAQSAVSRQIQNFEQELGCELFDRSSRGVTLTAAGETLLRYTRENAQLLEQLELELDLLRGVQRGHITLGTVEGFAASSLPNVLSRFQALYPAVTLEVLVAGSDAITTGVCDGSYDIGVAYNPTAGECIDIIAQATAPLCAVLSSTHPLAGSATLSMTDLLDYPLVAPAGLGGSRILFDAACRSMRRPLHPVLETNSAHVAAAFLLSSQGIAVLSPRMATPYILNGDLVAIRMREPVLNGGQLVLFTKRGATPSSAGQILCSMLAVALDRVGESQIIDDWADARFRSVDRRQVQPMRHSHPSPKPVPMR